MTSFVLLFTRFIHIAEWTCNSFTVILQGHYWGVFYCMHIYLSNLQFKNTGVISKLYAVIYIHVLCTNVCISVENKPKSGNTGWAHVLLEYITPNCFPKWSPLPTSSVCEFSVLHTHNYTWYCPFGFFFIFNLSHSGWWLCNGFIFVLIWWLLMIFRPFSYAC